jgi:hypothetical protein
MEERIMAVCWRCGERMNEEIIFTPKTHKENGRRFVCRCGNVEKAPRLSQHLLNHDKHYNRDWGSTLEKN